MELRFDKIKKTIYKLEAFEDYEELTEERFDQIFEKAVMEY